MIDILAAAGSASAAPAWTGWVLPLGMLLILWFLILRPQMRQQKQHRERVAGLAKGDEVVTAGGLVGKITKVDEWVHWTVSGFGQLNVKLWVWFVNHVQYQNICYFVSKRIKTGFGTFDTRFGTL